MPESTTNVAALLKSTPLNRQAIAKTMAGLRNKELRYPLLLTLSKLDPISANTIYRTFIIDHAFAGPEKNKHHKKTQRIFTGTLGSLYRQQLKQLFTMFFK